MKNEEKPYGNADQPAWHQVSSKSDECDALGGVTKKSQAVQQGAPAVSHPHEPAVKGTLSVENRSKSYAAYNQVAEPSHGGNIPAGKDVNEGQGLNYPQNRNKTKIAGDGKATVRNVQEKKDVMKVQANQNNDVSSRRANSWGNEK